MLNIDKAPTRTLLHLVADNRLINFCGGFLLGAALFAIFGSEKMGTEIPETITIALPAFLVILLAGVILLRKKILRELRASTYSCTRLKPLLH